MPVNGNERRKFRVVPRSHPLCPVVLYSVYRDGNIRAFRLPGEGGDHFHCIRWNLRSVIFGVELFSGRLRDFVVAHCSEDAVAEQLQVGAKKSRS